MEENEKRAVKQCKKCKEEINKAAKKCPICGARQGMPIWLIVIIVIVVIGIFAGLTGGGDETTESNNQNNSQKQVKADQKEIKYEEINVDELQDALESNAAAAKEKYNKKYFKIKGKLGNIDSDLKYFSLMSLNDEWDLLGIHCTLKNNDQKQKIKSLTKDQTITVSGQITDVGEVLGYYLDVTEIE